jgi:hypothetical protein
MFREFSEAVRPKDDVNATLTEAAERSLFEFSKQAWSFIRPGDPFVNGWVFGAVCEHVQACYDGQIKKLGIAAPPRHGKSLPVSVFAPAWKWTKEPQTRYMFISYQQRFSNIASMACRDLIKSPWYQDRWGHRFFFKEDTNRQDQFANDRGGFRLASGVGGGITTGEGGDIITADDPLSVEDSFSGAALEAVWRFWTQSMGLRFQNPEELRRIVCMQRLRKNDLLGRLIAERFGYEVFTAPFEGEPHRIYFLPAQRFELGLPPAPEGELPPKNAIIPTSLQIARADLRDTRKEGEILWPERFSNPATVKDLIQSVQAGAAGQLQQRPENDAGTVIKQTKFKLMYPTWTDKGLGFFMSQDAKPRLVYAHECMWYQTVDTAMKAEQANDETAAVTCCKTPYGELLFYDVTALRLLVPEQWPFMKQIRAGRPEWDDERREWSVPGRSRPWPRPLSFQAVEDKNSGTVLLQTARSEGYPLKPLVADVNKVMRAATLATLYENGNIYHNAEGSWRAAFEDQLTSFPTSPHDDMVDAAAYAAILFVHDNLLASYTGDLVYNDRVHEEVAAHRELEKANDEGAWIPPHLRPPEAVREEEDIDTILATLRGQPKPSAPAVDHSGAIRPEFLHDED